MSLYRPVVIKNLELPGNLFLAPVAGYTDFAFRSVCVENGADLTYTELASAEALVRDHRKTFKLLERAPNETRYAIQLFGANPDVMYRAALAIAPLKPSLIDINAGCPVQKVTKNGAGAALMRDPALLSRVVAAVVRAVGDGVGQHPCHRENPFRLGFFFHQLPGLCDSRS